MNLHENFNEDHDVFNRFGEPTHSTFTQEGEDLKFQKLTQEWNTGGIQLADPIILKSGSTFRFRFEPKTNTPDTYYGIGLALEKPADALSQYWYGGYIENGIAKITDPSGILATDNTFAVNKTYTVTMEILPSSDMNIHFNGPGFPGMSHTIPGPFINRSALFELNCFSPETILFKDFRYNE